VGGEDFVKNGRQQYKCKACDISSTNAPSCPPLSLSACKAANSPPFSTPPAPDDLLCPLTGNGIIPFWGQGFLNVKRVWARSPCGRARPHNNGKWHNSALLHSESRGSPSLRRLYRAAETAWMDTRLARSMHQYDKPQPLPPLPKRKKGGRG